MANEPSRRTSLKRNKIQKQAKPELEDKLVSKLPVWQNISDYEGLEHIMHKLEKSESELYETLNPLPELGDLSNILGPFEENAYVIKGKQLFKNVAQ